MMIFSRRQTFYALIIMAVGGWSEKGASQPRPAAVIVLNRVSIAFGYSISAISAFNNRLAKTVNHRSAIWNPISARQTRDRLRKFSSQLVEVTEGNSTTVAAMEDYHSLWSPKIGSMRPLPKDSSDPDYQRRHEDWWHVKRRLIKMLEIVNSSLAVLTRERGDFVQSAPYSDLTAAMNARLSLLGELRAAERPESAADFAALAQAIRRYRSLYRQLRRTVTLLDRYVLALGT